MSIKAKLLACLSILAVALVAMAAFAFYVVEEESRLANSIVADRVLPMEQLKKVADSYAVSIVDTVHKTRAGSLSPDDGKRNIETALQVIDDQWREYRATKLTSEETQIANRFETARVDTDQKLKSLLTLIETADLEALGTYADKELYPTIDPLGGQIDKLINLQLRVAGETLQIGNRMKKTLTAVMLTLAIAGIALIALSVWTVVAAVVRPLIRMTNAMSELAGGKLDVVVYGEGRRDEIGTMASAVAVFRNDAQERVRLESEAEFNRCLSDKEKIERDRIRATETEEVRFAVDTLKQGLEQLADGNLVHRINATFAEHLDGLRTDFNGSVNRFAMALSWLRKRARLLRKSSLKFKTSV